MKPDRFEILICLSSIAVVGLITTAAFGMAVEEPRGGPVSGGKSVPTMFAAAPPATFGILK
jgi:hypothetical protein